MSGWSPLIVAAAITAAVLQAIVGIAQIDREAIVFAVFFAAGVGILLRARQGSRAHSATVIVLGALFADVAFWMITATWSNVRNQEQVIYIIEPLALACAATAGLIAVAAWLLDRGSRWARKGAAIVIVATLATFVVSVGAAAVTGWGQEQIQRPDDLAVQIHNTAYSKPAIAARAHAVTLYVTNGDLFWHTVTIDRLGIDLGLPVGSHRRLTLSAPSGTYVFYCRIPGHRQAGMQGTITIP